MLFKELETDRLLLKNISKDDRNFILNQFSNTEVNRYLFDAEPLADIQAADEIIAFYIQPEPRLQHRWILVTKAEGIEIGTCGFHFWDTNNQVCDVGYDLNEAYWGKGYMMEAMQAILAFAADAMNLKRINACIYIENYSSLKLAERLGFKFEGKTQNLTFRGKEYEHRILTLKL